MSKRTDGVDKFLYLGKVKPSRKQKNSFQMKLATQEI